MQKFLNVLQLTKCAVNQPNMYIQVDTRSHFHVNTNTCRAYNVVQEQHSLLIAVSIAQRANAYGNTVIAQADIVTLFHV